jgi:menaquinone-dependent protoporphyrinogen oxidase
VHPDPVLGREEVRRFQAVAAGSPVCSGQWERDAVEFLLQRPAFRMRGGRSGDSRDWQAIDSWTDEIARQLSTSGSVR